MILLWLLSAWFVQEPEAAPAQQPEMRVEELQPIVEENQIRYVIRGLQIDLSPTQKLRANYAEVILDKDLYQRWASGEDIVDVNAQRQPESEDIQPPFTQSSSRLLLEFLGLPQQEALVRGLILRHAVEIIGTNRRLVCESLEYRAAEGITRVQQADLLLAAGEGPNGWPLRVIASQLQEFPDGRMEAQEASVTTCSSAEPHYELFLSSLKGVHRQDGNWSWEPQGGWLRINGSKILPLPTPDFSTGESFLGFRGVRLYVNDNVYGTALETEFGSETNLFDKEAKLRWSVFPTFSSRRGFPLRGVFEFKTKDLSSRLDLFYLSDQATDRHRMRNLVARDSDERWRIRWDNRWKINEYWRLDVDFALTGDPLIDPEFFNENWRREDDAYTEAYLRRLDTDSLLEARTLYRIDDVSFTPLQAFPTPGASSPQTLDLLPQARFLKLSSTLFDFPAGDLGGADGRIPVNVSWGAEAGRFRFRDRILDVPSGNPPYLRRPTVDRDRARVWAEIGVPFAYEGMFVRPGFQVQALAYDQGLQPNGSSAQRAFAEAFLEVGTVLFKKWDHGWQHRVLPQVRLRERRLQGARTRNLTFFDDFDRLKAGQVVEFSLRQFYYAPDSSNSWVDIDLLLPYYPDTQERLEDPLFPSPRRGDPRGHWGPAEVRVNWTPGVYGKTLEGVVVDTRIRQDLQQGRLDEIFTRITIQPDRYRLRYGGTFRRVADLFSIGDVFLDWRFADSWGIGIVQPFTFSGRPSKQARLELRHYSHDFVLSVQYSRDQAAGGSGIAFGIEPRFLNDRAPGTPDDSAQSHSRP